MRNTYFTRAELEESKAHVKGACAGAQDMFWSHTWQETQGHPGSQKGNRAEASFEAAHQEEETMAILDGCRTLAEAESE